MATDHSYDLVILGGGAAAFAAITEAERRNLSTAMVNTGLPLGGTCVNVGCVPSKHLLEVGKTAFEPPRNPFDAVAYDDDQPRTDWSAAINEKDSIVGSLREQNYVNVADHFGTDIYEGYGRLVDDTAIEVIGGEDAGTTITGEKVLIATGSSPHIEPIDGIESMDYETSETILERRDCPESVVMIGGGYVALEWGQILYHMGADVTLLQRSSHVLSGMEGQLGRELQRCFEADGIEVVTDATVDRVREENGDASSGTVSVDVTVGEESRTYTASDLFVSTGVRPNTDDTGLVEIGIETDDSGAVVVDETFQTANPDVYAAGDCIGEPMLETVAAKEGNHAVTNAFGDEGATIDYHAVPKVVFTSPEVAAVGTTELEYMDEHGTCTCRTVKMEDVPKAKAVEDTRGLVQVVKHHETDEIVGVHMIGPRAADMIPQATLAVKFGLTIDDIIDTIHPFPTFSEAFKHACQAFRRDTSKMSCCVE
ncbi:mercury(II) reductase [Halomarina oriensis]|uniref:Mercuric reductase n=1 Tax=Halomarina oriensis TaxID=671145 RepID=A0A6B0GU95_9EURY|nr:mercury(II) reductase [Halomarina oriensis]MWG35288.1 mercury(II) reductase [Halomarina oriensis]